MIAQSRNSFRWLVLFAFALCLVALPALAGDAPKKDASTDKAKAEHDAMMAEMMKYANPGPVHALLTPLVGKWKTTTKSWMGPEPTVSEGTCEREWIMGGRFLQSMYKGNMMGMPFEGMELLAFDMKKQQFMNVWIDNMGTTLSVGSGDKPDASGKVFTITSSFDDPVSGKTVPFKLVTKIIDPNSSTFTMIGTKDGKDHTEMEIAYTRVQ